MSQMIIELLNEEIKKRKKRNPQYSLRAFAKKVGVPHSTLSQILNGNRDVSFKQADSLLTQLNIEPHKKNTLLLSLSEPDAYQKPTQDEEFYFMSPEEVEFTYKWYFYGVLSALELKKVDKTAEGLSQFLKLNKEKCQEALDILLSMKAIKKREDGTYEIIGLRLSTKSGGDSYLGVKKAHINHMEKAIDYLQNQTKTQMYSDFTGTTVTIEKSKVPEARRRITEFRRSLMNWLTKDDHKNDEVYRLNIQLFPLSKGEGDS